MFDWNRSCSYDEQQKKRFHTTARSRLKKLAAELNLSSDSYDLRSNKAGIAVCGEITLQHDDAYIQVSQFGLSSGHGILIRTSRAVKTTSAGPTTSSHSACSTISRRSPPPSVPSPGLVETLRVPPSDAPPKLLQTPSSPVHAPAAGSARRQPQHSKQLPWRGDAARGRLAFMRTL